MRVITLTPPSLFSYASLRIIIDDIALETTERVVRIDEEGTERRIFLDFVGVLGDTLGLKATINLLGHNGRAI